MSVLAVALTLAVAGTNEQGVLKAMTGKWKAIVSFSEGGGRFTVSLAEDTEVRQVDPNTIAFSLKPVTSAHPVFNNRLTYDAPGKKYLLTVNTDSNPTIEKVALTYNGSDFSGRGSLKDAGGQTHVVDVKITPTPDGVYEWSFLDPTLPAKNNIVFGFTFFKRLK